MWSAANEFLPHSICLALQPAVLWLHAVSDAITALSYYSIPLVLVVFARKRAEGSSRWVLLLFAAFVLACGTTHLTSVVTLWWPIYVEQGVIKALTALISLVTAILLWPLLPVALRARTRTELEREVADRTAELEQAKLVAERANEAKSRFLAAASHDLRQPFQAMELYHHVLEGRLTDPESRQVVVALGSALAGGRDLLNALLHISTLEAGVTVPHLVDVDMRETLSTLADEFINQAERQGLRFRVLPCSAVVSTDPVLFTRMVRNLLVNALRYTQSGGVLLGCRRVPGHIRVEVWDTGPGIPPERQAEIWEEFTQLGNPERDRTQGLGLGLAIVARTGKLLNHRVGGRSRLGKGSVFFIEVPLATAASIA